LQICRLLIAWMTLLSLVACASQATDGKSSPSPSSPVAAASPSAASSHSPGPGVAIALKGSATITFRAAGFSREYQLASGSNTSNGLEVGSGQAFLDLGGLSTEELRVTVISGGAPGVTLKGAGQVLASFEDETAHVGGIATVGQGICTLTLTRFGSDGLAGDLDCQDVAPSMGAGSPVGFQASLDAVPA
jgi:hypothetical protein